MMMVATPIAMPIRQRRDTVLRHIEAWIDSFCWALELKRCCDDAVARGQKLDGDTLREIVREAEARRATS
jgi:hypothetical protein